MSLTLVEFDEPVRRADGTFYHAKACGRERADGLWEGWIEFEDMSTGEFLRTTRETTQPNRTDAVYWATGLTPTFLEGAVERTRSHPMREVVLPSPPAFDGPAESFRSAPPRAERGAILDPFSVYRKSPVVLAQELQAFRRWHLRQIIQSYGLADQPLYRLDRMTKSDLTALIVRRVAELSTGAR